MIKRHTISCGRGLYALIYVIYGKVMSREKGGRRMICTRCGAEIGENIICPECGNIVEKQENSPLEIGESINETAEKEINSDPVKIVDNVAENYGFDWQAAHQSSNQPEKKPDNKIVYIVMGVIGAAIAATLLFLVLNLAGVGDPKKDLEKAFANTVKELSGQETFGKMAEVMYENNLLSQQLIFAINNVVVTENGEKTELMEENRPIRFELNGTTDKENQSSWTQISGGVGECKDIRFEVFFDEDGYLFGFPDLYKYYLSMTPEEMEMVTGVEVNLEEGVDSDKTAEAMASLGKTFTKWLKEAYQDVKCEKTKNVKLNSGNEVLRADQYDLTISRRNYEKHLKKLPSMISSDETFMSWYIEMTSKKQADELIESLEEVVENSMVTSRVSHLVICSAWVYDKKVVEIKFPLDTAAENMAADIEFDELSGYLDIAFLGKENIGDDLRVNLYATLDGERFLVEFSSVKDGNTNEVSFNTEIAGFINVSMKAESEYDITEDRCEFRLHNAELDVYIENSFSSMGLVLNMDGSYVLAKGNEFSAPDVESKQLMEMSEDEAQEMVVTILENAQTQGCIPSVYESALLGFLDGWRAGMDSSKNPGDNGGGQLDGSEYMTYEEFAELVKTIYGDMYSEEDMREVYQNLYGDIEYDTNGIVYGSNGLPYLFCDYEDVILEIQPAEGFLFSKNYSDAYTVEYDKYIGDTDLIVMTYNITEEDVMEYLQEAVEYQEEYYTESGYPDFTIGKIETGIINGYTVSWMEYRASDGVNKANGILAYAQIGDHGCVLDIYSIYGSESVSEELLKQCFQMKLIEN